MAFGWESHNRESTMDSSLRLEGKDVNYEAPVFQVSVVKCCFFISLCFIVHGSTLRSCDLLFSFGDFRLMTHKEH